MISPMGLELYTPLKTHFALTSIPFLSSSSVSSCVTVVQGVDCLPASGSILILGVEYLLTAGISDVLIPFVVKSIMGAFCAICVYRIKKINF